MKIYVHRIPINGRNYSLTNNETWLQKSLEDALGGDLVHCDAELALQRHDDQVHVSGQMRMGMRVSCDLCGDDIEIGFDGKINLFYVSANSPQPDLLPKSEKDLERINDMFSLNKDDLEEGWYYDGVLDLGVVLAEHVLINKESVVSCQTTNAKRLTEGLCKSTPTEGSKNTYKPFAGLNLS